MPRLLVLSKAVQFAYDMHACFAADPEDRDDLGVERVVCRAQKAHRAERYPRRAARFGFARGGTRIVFWQSSAD